MLSDLPRRATRTALALPSQIVGGGTVQWNMAFLGLGVLGLLGAFMPQILNSLGMQIGAGVSALLSGAAIAVASGAFAMFVVGLYPAILHSPILSVVGAGFLGALLFGAEARVIYVYSHLIRPAELTLKRQSQPIIWKWDEGSWYFLGAVGGVGDRTWIVGFQARGRNRSGRTIRGFGGYIESGITGERHTLQINIGGHLRPITDTARIPDGAEFDVGVRFPDQYPGPRQAPNQAGISADKFREQWRSLTFVFEYDGQEYRRRFTADDIENLLRRFHDDTHRDVKPHVTQ